MTTLVQLDGAARWFGAGHTRVVALQPTTLVVESGELLAVMGPSGSGRRPSSRSSADSTVRARAASSWTASTSDRSRRRSSRSCAAAPSATCSRI